MMKKRWVKSLIAIALSVSMFGSNTLVRANTISEQQVMIQRNTSDTCNTQLKTEQYSTEATSNMGEMLKKEIDVYGEEKTVNGDYSISEVEIDGKNAHVIYHSKEDCTLLVEIFSDDGKELLGFDSAKVSAGDKSFDFELAIDTMPEYYLIKSQLVSTELGRPLSTEYSSPMHTKKMQQFLATTIDDFEGEEVVNLDSDNTNNFAVYKSDVKIIEQNGDHNKVEMMDEENENYEISNIDSQIANLKEGDIFSYKVDDSSFLIVKIKTIDINQDNATIKGENLELEEVFSYVKIDTVGGVDTDTLEEENDNFEVVDENTLTKSNFKTYSLKDKVSDSDKFSLGGDIEAELKGDTFQGSLTLGMHCEIQCYIDLGWFSEEHYVSVTFLFTETLNIGSSGDVPYEKELGRIPIAVMPYGLSVQVAATFCASIEVKGGLEQTFTFQFGFSHDSDNGLQRLDTEAVPLTKNEVGFKLEGSGKVSLEIEPQLCIFSNKIASAGITTEAGLEISASMDVLTILDTSDTGEEEHECEQCVAGEIKFFLELGVDFELGDGHIVDIDKVFAKFEHTFTEFYYSITFDEAGLGKCPHKAYRTTWKVIDLLNLSAFEGVKVKVGNEELVTDSNGKCYTHLKNGSYKYKVEKEGYETVTGEVKVEDAGPLAIVTLLPERENDDKKEDDKKNDDPSGEKDATGIAINATNFPDEKFRSYVKENFDSDSNNYLNETEVNAVTDILVGDSNISNLKGVEYFTNLESLHCGSNNLSSLDVSRNTKLETLSCYKNSLSSLNLGSNSKLVELDCSDNRLTSLNVSSNSQLEGLWCDNNSLSSLNVSSNSNLARLSCTGNNITAIDISGNSKLDYFACDPDVEVTDPQGVYTANIRKKILKKQAVSNNKTETYRDLDPNETYMFYVFKEGTEYGNGIEAKDLCYVQQVTADGNGEVSISYRSDDEEGFTKLVGRTVDLKEISANAKDLQYNGKLRQTLVSANCGSYILEEGKDYTVSGDITATEPGEYTVELTGIGEFSGTYKVNYKITEDAVSADTPEDTKKPMTTDKPQITDEPAATDMPQTTVTPQTTDMSQTTNMSQNTVMPQVTATPEPYVEKIEISGNTKKVAAGKKIKLKATVWPQNITGQIEWSSSMPSCASVDQNGVVTAKKEGIGSRILIKVVAVNGPGATDDYEIQIMRDAVKSVKLQPASKSVKAGKKVKIKATVKTTGSQAYKALKWTSSNTKYATVDRKGNVTTKKGGKGKTVKITAASLDGTNKKATVKIKIK